MKQMNEKELPKLRRGGLFVVALVLLIFVLLDAFILNMSKVSIYQNIWSLPVFFVPLPSNIRGACRNDTQKQEGRLRLYPLNLYG